MSPQRGQGPGQRAEAARALAASVRVDIIRLLHANGALTVLELARLLAVPASRLRHHLAMLRELALVERERLGRQTSYRIADKVVTDLLTDLAVLARENSP